MEELLRTNDPVIISVVGSLLGQAGIAHFVADGNMSILEGSLGIIPRRVMVDSDDIDAARRLMRDADLGHELSDPRK
ncbi:putative signal transducing protein [Pannonibacter sp.]|uniref:putative signal transducing protein n=1 Tax=Pannonibacter sp. TaxID=1906786 RepID=UPI003F72DF52